MGSFGWVNTSAVPGAITGRLAFSDIVNGVVYVLDGGNNAGAGVDFYRYNLATDVWTTLTAPAGGYRYDATAPILVRIGATKILAICDVETPTYGWSGGNRIAIYDIATGVWTYSSVQPYNPGPQSGGHVFTIAVQDSDTLWCFVVEDDNPSSAVTMKCLRYVISTDTWTSFAATMTNIPQPPVSSGYDNGYVTASIFGTGNVYQYEVAVDTYATYVNPGSGYQYVVGAAPVGYIPFIKATALDWLGYLDISASPALSNTPLQLIAPPGLASPYLAFGFNELLTSAIAWAYGAVVPQVNSVWDYQVQVDWNNDGDYSDAGENISADVKGMAWERGVESELERVATGTLELTVRNETGKYSPENAASALYPNLLPGRPIRVQAVIVSTTYTLFTGYLEKIIPRPKAKVAYLLCVDGTDRLNRNTINAPARGIIAGVTMGATAQVSGVNITFADADPDTITRASGSFIDDGFLPGMRVYVAGSADNNSGAAAQALSATYPYGYVIAGVTALVLTLHGDESLANEGPVAGVTLDGYGPIGIILDETGWPWAKRSLDQGLDTLDFWWAHKEKPLDAIQTLMDVEKSLAYINGNGVFVYENRHHRLTDGSGGASDHLASQGTFSDTMIEMEYEVSSRPIRNIAVVTGHERTAAALPVTTVWGTRDNPKIEGYDGVTAKPIIIWAHLEEPCAGISPPATDGTDYGISATPGGADSPTLRANVFLLATVYGQSVKMQFTNLNSQDVYIVNGSVPGTPPQTLIITGQLYEDDEAFVKQEDATSRAAYGDRSVEVENPFVGGFNPLQAYAEWLVGRFRGIDAAGSLTPMPDAVRIHLSSTGAAMLTQILAREISDRITLTVTSLGLSAKQYYINKMRHEVSDGGTLHQCTWWLERVDENKFWLLETPGYGELAVATRVGF